MTTAVPTDTAMPAHPVDLISATAWPSKQRSGVKVPLIGVLAAASVLGSALQATSVTPVLAGGFAPPLHEIEFHGQLRGSSKHTSTYQVDDIRPLLIGTSLITFNYDRVLTNPFRSTDTRMTQLQALASGLSLREWAELFGVSKQAIRNWMESEPRNRPELDAALGALRAAALRHSDLAGWLLSALPGSTRTPLQLAQEGRWRALTAASRMLAPVGLAVAPTNEMRDVARERRALSRRLGGADAPPAGDDED
jgi:hypothetical protein